jgi:hypothetical protein
MGAVSKDLIYPQTPQGGFIKLQNINKCRFSGIWVDLENGALSLPLFYELKFLCNPQ